jgi:hypothetical protein
MWCRPRSTISEAIVRRVELDRVLVNELAKGKASARARALNLSDIDMCSSLLVYNRKDMGEDIMVMQASLLDASPYPDTRTLAKISFNGTWMAGNMFPSLARATVAEGACRVLRTERRIPASRKMKEVLMSVRKSCCEWMSM